MNTESKRGKRISLVYYSGTGGTRLVAELLGELLSERNEIRVLPVSDTRAAAEVAEADFPVFLYPTFFLRPAPSMREFIGRIGPFAPPRDAYVVTTYELYAENSIRAAALALKARGVAVTGSRAVRAPGSDVTCLVPSRLTPWLYRFEKAWPRKLLSIAAEIDDLAGGRPRGASIPAPKWYTPFAQLLQLTILNGFEGWRGKFRVLGDRCSLCGACVAGCDRRAWELSAGVLLHIPERCELCLRCAHHCPRKAIVLIEGLKDNRRLDRRLYASLKEETRRVLNGGKRGTAARTREGVSDNA
jgi:ferredoxin